MSQQLPATLFDTSLADEPGNQNTISMPVADQLFDYFKNSTLFRWGDANNDCEDRANAICMLLDVWGIPNYKAWVFSGFFRRKNFGNLVNDWNYHVAALLPVQEENNIGYYVIDPATSPVLETIEKWALRITANDTSYHFIKDSKYYIFPPGKIERDNWFTRNKRNYRWTIQGLSGVNGVSSKGKAQLAFNKRRVKRTEVLFKRLMKERPRFLDLVLPGEFAGKPMLNLPLILSSARE